MRVCRFGIEKRQTLIMVLIRRVLMYQADWKDYLISNPNVTITALLNHFGIPSHTGKIHSIDVVLINILLEGNPVALGVDSDEFRRKLDGNPLGVTSYNDLTSDDPLRTELDHSVLATGIRIDVETGEIFIIFNESGGLSDVGAGVEIPLVDAIKALDDWKFSICGSRRGTR